MRLEDLKGRLRDQAQRREICLLAAEIGSAETAGDETRGRWLRWSSKLREQLVRWRLTPQRILREKALRASRHRAWKGSIARILSWAEQLMAAPLPRHAWDCRSFRFEARGRTVRCRAITAQSALRSLWLFRLRELDSDNPRLAWHWEAAVEHLAGSAPTLTVRIHTEVASPDSDAEHSPLSRMPEFVGGIAREFGLWSAAVRLSANPTWVEGETAAVRLGQELLDPDRKCVAILVMGSEEGAAGQLRADALSESAAGIAKVFELTADSARTLSGWLGLDLTEGGTSVRVVSPGVGSDTDWSDQLKFDSEDLASAEAAGTAADWMMSVAMTVSLEQFQLRSDVTPFDEARRNLQQRRGRGARREPAGSHARSRSPGDGAAAAPSQTPGAWAGWLLPTRWIQAVRASVSNLAKRSENAKLTEDLAAKRDEVRRLTEELKDKEDDNKWYSDEHAHAEKRAEAAEADLNLLRPKLEELERRLRDRGEDPDIPMPESWAVFESWLDENLAARVQLHSRARREIRKTAFKDVAVAARGVIWLATQYRDARISGTGSDLRGHCARGLSNERCGGDSFQIDWGGGKAEVGWHVKNTNTMDPERCLRIYYVWDATNQQVVIASMPGHV